MILCKLLIPSWCRRWDLNLGVSKESCNFQILHCSGCQRCHRCRRPLPDIALWAAWFCPGSVGNEKAFPGRAVGNYARMTACLLSLPRVPGAVRWRRRFVGAVAGPPTAGMGQAGLWRLDGPGGRTAGADPNSTVAGRDVHSLRRGHPPAATPGFQAS
jgi:hypothetical protein